MAFYIKHGMGGGYGGEKNVDWELVDVDTMKDANEWARDMACEDFESSGEFDFEVFAEENPDADSQEEWEAYCQERESWIFYIAEEFEEDPNV